MFSRVFCQSILSASILFLSSSSADCTPVSEAKALIEICTDSQRAVLVSPFDASGRTDWHYVPRDRTGFPLAEMNEVQKERLWSLLRTALSETGLEKVQAVIRLEQVLLDLEKSPNRDPGKYYLSIWGEPSPSNRWGWRFEGHHTSVNVTLEGEETISVTPTFFGANPATLGTGEDQGFRALSAQEDRAREFMLSLPKEQREKAIVAGDLTDVESGGQPQIEPKIVSGLACSELSQDDRGLLEETLESYSEWFLPEIAEKLGLASQSLVNDPDLIVRWIGGLGEGDELHTYRISGKSFDIQYANNQSAANHVHTLVRSIGHDFGQ